MSSLGALDRLVIVLVFVAFTRIHEVLVFGPPDEILGFLDYQTRIFLRYFWIVLYLPLAILLLLRIRPMLTVVGSDVWLAALMVMCLLSTVWSDSAEETLRRSLALLMTAGFAYYVAALFHPLSVLRLLAVALTLGVGIGLGAGLLAPDVGISTSLHPGSWRGVFNNKNEFGQIAALNCVTLLVLWKLEGAHRVWLALALIASFTAVLLSNSVTALIVAVAVAVVLVLVTTMRRYLLATLALASVCVGLGDLLLSSIDTVLDWSGRDSTLTGRTLIWRVAWELVRERPLLGYGYGAFWVERGEAASFLQETVGFAAASAHTGYLDLLLQLGVVGLTLFVLSVCTTIFRMLARDQLADRALVLACSAAITFVLAYNVAESDLLQQNRLLTFLYVWAVVVARGREIGTS